MELMPHQIEAAKQLGNGKILWGEVGTGKSETVMAYYMDKEFGKDIYVITTAKKRDSLDWEGAAARCGISTERSISIGGSITIDSWNNIGKYVDVDDAFFILDEQRLVGSGVWVRAFLRIAKRNNWVMLTATPGDTWMDYIPVFVANGLYKNRTEFLHEHVVFAPFSRYPKIVRYEHVDVLEKYRNMILVEMPYLKDTVRILKEVEVSYDHELFKKVVKERWNPYTNEPIRDAAELWRVLRRIVNTDLSRLRAVQQILEKHPRLIVFYQSDPELEILRSLAMDPNLVVAEWNGHKHEKLPDNENWVYLVQYQAGAEGWNCIETDAMCLFVYTYSWKSWTQSMGRIDRMNNKYKLLYYYILNSNSVVDRAIKASLKNKKLFNEAKYASKLYKNMF